MTKTTRTRSNPTISMPPHWLSRAEKLAFRAIIAERKAAGLPLSAMVRDTIVDYVLTRARVRELRKTLTLAQAEISELDSDRAYILSLHKELDRASRLAGGFAARIESKP